MNKLRKILEDFITEDDNGRKKVKYDLGKTIKKYEKKIRNLKLQDIVCLLIILSFLCITKPSQATSKCYKDICVGQKVLITNGLYKNNSARVFDIIKEETPYDDAEQIKDYFRYYLYLPNGFVVELYREEIRIIYHVTISF